MTHYLLTQHLKAALLDQFLILRPKKLVVGSLKRMHRTRICGYQVKVIAE
jgi:hypothetical protein